MFDRFSAAQRRAAMVQVSAALALVLALPLNSALADNAMGYRLLDARQAAELQRSGGSLGMRVGAEHEIHSGGMTFELLKVESIAAGSPASEAGLKVGDQLIAVDGRVFPNVAAFAGYVGSVAPGHRMEIDYIPEGGGPGQAQRLAVTVGEGGRAAPKHEAAGGTGLSTGSKVAIGLGAAALIGCYESGCYARLKNKIQEERERHEGEAPSTAPLH